MALGDAAPGAAMIARGERVVYRGERSPDFPDAAYRGTVVAVDGEVAQVLFDDGEEYEVAVSALAREAGASGAGGDGR